MRFAALLLLACCGPSATAVRVPRVEAKKDAEREAAAALAKSGRLERAVAAFTALNVKRPETRAETYAVEIDALGALFRCDEVRDLAAIIDAGGDEAAMAAAKSAREECGRVAKTPSEAADERMRDAFRRDDYAKAWDIAPSLAALLALARTAKTRGDAAFAERTYERALAYAERSDQKARVAIGRVAAHDDPPPRVLDVDATRALAVFGPLLVSQDLASGALRVVASIPSPWFVRDAAGQRAVIVNQRTHAASIMTIGVDDLRTSMPLPRFGAAERIVMSRDGELVAEFADGSVRVADARTGKTLAETALRTTDASPVGFTDAHALVVSTHAEMCTMAAPDWACRSSTDLGQNSRRAATLAGHVLAFQPNANMFVVYDLATKKTLSTLQGHFQTVTDLVLAPDASKLFSLSQSRMVQWDVATHRRDDLMFVFSVPYFSSDGHRYVEIEMNALLVRDVVSMTKSAPVVAAGGFPLPDPKPELSFGTDGKLAVHLPYATAKIDLETRKVEWAAHDIAAFGDSITATSPDKKWTASADGGAIRVNDTTIEIGPDAAVFMDATGHATVSGNEASVRCVVGDEWLPLDACRDRLLSRP